MFGIYHSGASRNLDVKDYPRFSRFRRATVWCLRESTNEESEEFKSVLVRLSGKRLGRGRSPTTEMLLAGLFVLLRMFDFLVSFDFDLSKIAKLNAAFSKLLQKTQNSQKNS